MVVDPRKPEKGVYAASFDIPTECSCSVVKFDEILISTAVGRNLPHDDDDGGIDREGEKGGGGGGERGGGNLNLPSYQPHIHNSLLKLYTYSVYIYIYIDKHSVYLNCIYYTKQIRS